MKFPILYTDSISLVLGNDWIQSRRERESLGIPRPFSPSINGEHGHQTLWFRNPCDAKQAEVSVQRVIIFVVSTSRVNGIRLATKPDQLEPSGTESPHRCRFQVPDPPRLHTSAIDRCLTMEQSIALLLLVLNSV